MAPSKQILSIYLGSKEKKSPTTKILITQLHSLVSKSLTAEQKKLFRKDIIRMERYLGESFDSRNRRSIVFFSSGNRLWRVYTFEFFLPPQCVVSDAPFTQPLDAGVKTHKKYLVLLVDREKARLFTVHLGKIEEHTDFLDGHVPQKVKHGDDTWDAPDKIFRHIEDHLHRHLMMIAEGAKKFIQDKTIHFLILGGHQEMIPKVRAYLPTDLQKKIKGEFITELNVPINDIFLKKQNDC